MCDFSFLAMLGLLFHFLMFFYFGEWKNNQVQNELQIEMSFLELDFGLLNIE